MSKELEALNYLVNLAVVGNKENNRGKVFTSEEIISQALKHNEPMKVLEKQKVSCGLSIILNGICPKCHHQIHNNQKFCDECGKSLDWSE